MAFLLPNRRKSKIGLRPGKKLTCPKFCFPKYTVQVGARGHEFEACSAQLASNVTSTAILNLVCIVRCDYNTSETPSLGFLHLSVIISVIVKTQ
jgi:hypothetical protein